MAKPTKPTPPAQALRSDPATFRARAELAIDYQWTEFPNYLDLLADFVDERADEALAAALGGDLPALTGKAGQYIRVNAGETAAEFTDEGAFTTIDVASRFTVMPIGMPFPVWDHLTGAEVPSNAGTAKFIKLTAGLTGAGAFNEGLLTSESVTGSAPLVVATADIVGGPMDGETIHLLNTMEAFLRGGTTSGVFQQDQMQRITGRIWNSGTGRGFFNNWEGALDNDGQGSTNQPSSGSVGEHQRFLKFDNANSPNARVSSTTDGETRSKNVSITLYMRII